MDAELAKGISFPAETVSCSGDISYPSFLIADEGTLHLVKNTRFQVGKTLL